MLWEASTYLYKKKSILSPRLKYKQDRQCTYNVTFWHVRAIIVAVEEH